MPNHTISTKRVMLIDDSEIDLKINTKILSLHFPGMSISRFTSAEDGLSYLKKNLGEPGLLPNYILLDIQMPDMDGFGFLDIYKLFPKHFTDQCSVIILSSTLDFGDIIRAEANSHVFKMLKKPLNAEELRRTLSS